MRTILIATIALLALLVEGNSAAAQTDGFIVVVHATNRTESLTQAELSRIFLRRDTHWVDGRPVLPVDQPRNSVVRSAFTTGVHGRTVGRAGTGNGMAAGRFAACPRVGTATCGATEAPLG
jgi:ABC-type phosphate transport system substrate-binding protein